MNSPAPIALFVYNRPENTLKTLQCLSENIESKESKLFIFCDGPKKEASETQRKKIEETREIIRSKKWCGEVHITESSANKGLANSIIEGVTKIVNEYGSVIVLEDDMLTSRFFLKYMNEALEFYKEVEQVISIHGYLYPVKEHLPETFFLKGADCWGWATWKRGWDLFEPDGGKLIRMITDRKSEYEFNFDGTFPYLKMLKKQIEGKNDSWAIRWYASAFLKNKLTLYPGRSLVKNIGIEGVATHEVINSEWYDAEISQTPIFMEKIQLKVNDEAFEAVRKYFVKSQPSFLKRLLHKFRM